MNFAAHEEPLVCLSTAHVTWRDLHQLKLGWGPTARPNGEYGFFIVVPHDGHEFYTNEAFSAEFQSLMKDVKDHGYLWLLLDRAAPVHEGYPYVYEEEEV